MMPDTSKCPICGRLIKAGDGEWIRDDDLVLQFVHADPSCTRGYERLSITTQESTHLN
jgi:hypothetical protein